MCWGGRLTQCVWYAVALRGDIIKWDPETARSSMADVLAWLQVLVEAGPRFRNVDLSLRACCVVAKLSLCRGCHLGSAPNLSLYVESNADMSL